MQVAEVEGPVVRVVLGEHFPLNKRRAPNKVHVPVHHLQYTTKKYRGIFRDFVNVIADLASAVPLSLTL